MNTNSPIKIISLFSILGGVGLMIFPWMIQFGMSSYPAEFSQRVLQFLMYGLLHGNIWHVMSNILFFFMIGAIVEDKHGYRYVWFLWIWTTLFVGIILMHYASSTTIGASGFAMALLGVYTIDLYQGRNQEYKSALLLLTINILIGLQGNISLLGHLSGAIAGAIFALVAITGGKRY